MVELIISTSSTRGLDQGTGLGPSIPVGLASCATWGSVCARGLLSLFAWHLGNPEALGHVTKAPVCWLYKAPG